MEEVIDKAKENRDLTRGNLLKKILIYLLPLFAANVLQLLFTTVDLFTVSHFGEGNTSSGAIGATNTIVNLIICIFWGVTGGVSIVVANAKGAKDYVKLNKAIGNSVLIMAIGSIFVLFAGILLAKPLLIAVETSEEFLEKSTIYLSVYFLGAPFNILYNTGASILRAFGDTKRPLLAVVVSGLVNIAINFALVKQLDVLGVAIGTVASQAISMIIVFIFLVKDKKLAANFHLRHLRFYKEETLDILRLGLASGLQSFIFNFTNVNVQKCLNILGPEVVIGKAGAANLEGYEYSLINTISQTCLVSCSQNYGSKDKKRVDQSLIICLLLELVLSTLFNSIVLLLNRQLLSLFIVQGEATTEGAFKAGFTSLLIMGLPYAICGMAECFAAYLRGMKYAVVPTIVTLVCIVGVRMIYILFLFDLPFFHSMSWLIGVYPISWILCTSIYIPISLYLGKKAFKKL